MQWIFLLAAGLLEVGWAVSLKLTNGFTNYLMLVVNVCFGLAAAFCLAQSMRSLPISVAYPIWKGVAIIGLVLYETYLERQSLPVLRLGFALLIVVGIVGLKIVAPPATR